MIRRFFSFLIIFSIAAAAFAEAKAKDIASEAAKKATVEESISYVKNQLKSLTVASEKRAAYVFLASLQEQLANVHFGDPDSCDGQLDGLLSNTSLFAADLVACGLSPKIENMLSEMLSGPGAVKMTLKKYVG